MSDMGEVAGHVHSCSTISAIDVFHAKMFPRGEIKHMKDKVDEYCIHEEVSDGSSITSPTPSCVWQLFDVDNGR